MITFKEFITEDRKRTGGRRVSMLNPLVYAIARTASSMLASAAKRAYNDHKEKQAAGDISKAEQNRIDDLQDEYKSIAKDPIAARKLLLQVSRDPMVLFQNAMIRTRVLKILDAIDAGIVPTGQKWELLTSGDQKYKLSKTIRAILDTTGKFRSKKDENTQLDTLKHYLEVLAEKRK